MSRTLDQERAGAAMKSVMDVKDKEYAREFGQMARKAPASIQINGLGQTLAFLKAKNKPAHTELYKAVQEWVGQRFAPQKDLLTWIIKDATSDDYRRATAEALAFLNWVKRFAEAELTREPNDGTITKTNPA